MHTKLLWGGNVNWCKYVAKLKLRKCETEIGRFVHPCAHCKVLMRFYRSFLKSENVDISKALIFLG